MDSLSIGSEIVESLPEPSNSVLGLVDSLKSVAPEGLVSPSPEPVSRLDSSIVVVPSLSITSSKENGVSVSLSLSSGVIPNGSSFCMEIIKDINFLQSRENKQYSLV